MPVMGFTKFERFLRAAWLAAARGPAHPGVRTCLVPCAGRVAPRGGRVPLRAGRPLLLL